jgi:hypothetical protein
VIQASPPPPPPSPPPPPAVTAPPRVGAVTGGRTATACPLTIAFASYGAGIDNPTRERVQAMLVGDRAVTGFDAQRWGREGEVTLCIRTSAAPDAARLFHQARALIPAQPRGPIIMRTSHGLSYETAPLRR